MQFINNFRGIAILMVIFAHSISSLLSLSDSSTLAVRLTDMHLNNCTVLFVVIAGYFFSVLSGSYRYLPFLKNKFMTVIMPYAFISFPAILLYILQIKTYHSWVYMDWFDGQLGSVGQYIYLMITGAHLGPLWFVPMIILFYVLSPLFILIQKREWLFTVFFVSLIPALYWGRPEYNDNTLHSFVFFLPAYVLGMLLFQRKWLYEAISRISGRLLCLYVGVASVFYMVVDINSSIDLMIKLFLTVLLLAFCKQHVRRKVKLLDLFSRLSFFLFFIHGYFTAVVRMSLRELDVHYVGFLPVVGIFIFTIVMSLSLYVVAKLILKEKTKVFLGA